MGLVHGIEHQRLGRVRDDVQRFNVCSGPGGYFILRPTSMDRRRRPTPEHRAVAGNGTEPHRWHASSDGRAAASTRVDWN
jgi:hypothetical protein